MRAQNLILLSRTPGFSIEAQAFIDRLITPSTDARAAQYAALIDTLTSGGVLAKLDGLYTYATRTEESAFLNLKSSKFYSGRFVDGGGAMPTFTVDRGFSSPSITYIATFYNPSIDAVNLTLNSAMVCGYYLPASQDTGSEFGTDDGLVRMTPWSNANTSIFALNSATPDTLTPSPGAMDGLWMVNRTAGNAVALYRNNVQLMVTSRAATALANGYLFSGYGPTPAAFFAMGAGLSDAERAVVYSAATTYLSAIGAI